MACFFTAIPIRMNIFRSTLIKTNRNMRIPSPSYLRLLGAGLALSLLSSCGADQSAEDSDYYTIAVSNPKTTTFKDAGFEAAIPENSAPGWALYDAGAEAWLPAQQDDLDGDGRPETLFFLADLKGKSSRSLAYQPAPDSFEASQRSQIVFKVQDRPFAPETAREMLADYTQREALTVPGDLTPQNMWVMFEGPVWENDLVAYRFYMDDRFRTDIYGKKVRDMVMDTVGWDYHDLKDWGSDILKVGNSLGIGSPAIWYQEKAYALSQTAKKDINIIANGPLRSILRVTFEELEVDTFRLDLTVDFEIQAGHQWTEVRMQSKTPLPDGMKFATGIVKHTDQINAKRYDGVQTYYNWDNQSYHGQQLGFALMAKESQEPVLYDSELDHLMILNASNKAATYRFMAVWEEDPMQIRGIREFREHLEQEAAQWGTAFRMEGGK
jgi:hypothetical protein